MSTENQSTREQETGVASNQELIDGAKGRWGLNKASAYEAELLRRLEAPQPSSPPADAWIENAAENEDGAMVNIGSPSILAGLHRWVGQRAGGDPTEAASTEWVKYCADCGMEYSEDVPPCPGSNPAPTSDPAQMPSCHVCGTIMQGVCPKCGADTKPTGPEAALPSVEDAEKWARNWITTNYNQHPGDRTDIGEPELVPTETIVSIVASAVIDYLRERKGVKGNG